MLGREYTEAEFGTVETGVIFRALNVDYKFVPARADLFEKVDIFFTVVNRFSKAACFGYRIDTELGNTVFRLTGGLAGMLFTRYPTRYIRRLYPDVGCAHYVECNVHYKLCRGFCFSKFGTKHVFAHVERI